MNRWRRLIGAYGFAPGFAVAAAIPLVAAVVTPADAVTPPGAPR